VKLCSMKHWLPSEFPQFIQVDGASRAADFHRATYVTMLGNRRWRVLVQIYLNASNGCESAKSGPEISAARAAIAWLQASDDATQLMPRFGALHA
jgi:hypothetical protein